MSVNPPGMRRGEYLFSRDIGITCNANIPTEEVFTTPHARRVDGHVVSSKPLSYQGSLIDGIAARFEGGRIIEAKAARGAEVLNKVLDTDDGARRLGEVALVPHSSPISKSGLLFYNTLFDENAACHIALGQCYSKCFVDGAKLTPDDIAARGDVVWRELGAVDEAFRIALAERDVAGRVLVEQRVEEQQAAFRDRRGMRHQRDFAEAARAVIRIE